MSLLTRSRVMTRPVKSWKTLIHNDFDTYTNALIGDGNPFVVKDGGEWVEIVSNGKNKNDTSFFNNPRFVYADIKDKLCRITWNFETDNPATFEATGFSNISLGLFRVQNQTSGNISNNRASKYDIVTSSKTENYLGGNSIEFVPSDLFNGLAQADYFGWNIGFRSSNNGLIFRLLQFDFEVFD